jgi:diguanylate cyclase (GGDEF)-like protein/PAS domain S-box-containing protein
VYLSNIQQYSIFMDNTKTNMKLNQVINLNEMIELMLDAVCVVDKSGHIVFVSSAFEYIFGYKAAEVINEPIAKFVVHDDREKTASTVNKILSGTEQRSFENRWTHKSGQIINVLWSARWSEKHQVRIAVAHDITERKKMEDRLQFLANHDQLTKLPNRAFLEKSLQQSLAQAKREITDLCLLFIDVDNFKIINDMHGHGVGDQILKVIAKRLLETVRESDSVGRLGGDEFLIILNTVKAKHNAYLLAEKICTVIEQPICIDENLLQLTVSIGIAFYPDDVADEQQLLQQADQAMYKAKRAGGNSVRSLFNH